MCLIMPRVENDNAPRPQFAVEDIIVFKVLRLRKPTTLFTTGPKSVELVLTSPYRLTGWVQGETKKAMLDVPERRTDYSNGDDNPTLYWGIEEGLHALRTRKDAYAFIEEFKTNFFVKLREDVTLIDLRIFKAVIPSGSWYHVGVNGDIVADHLTLVEEIQ